MLKVAILCPEYPPGLGGLGDYTHHLAGRLVARGVQVEVLTRSSSGPGHSERREESRRGAEGVSVGRMRDWDFRLLRDIKAHLGDAHILHIQYQTGAYGMHPAVNLLPGRVPPNVRTATTFHDLRPPYLFPKAGPVRNWVTAQLARNSTVVIATNPEDATRLTDLRGKPVPIIPIGPNILPVDGAAAAAWQTRTRWEVPLSSSLVGYFGFLNRSKGVLTLLRGFRELLDRGVPAVLMMAGESAGASDITDAAHRREVERLALTLKLAPHLRWTGPLPPEDLSRCLAALDCCALPYSDGASYRRGTLISALAHGIPIVTTSGAASDIPGPLHPLVDGEHCLLVPPENPALLSQTIQRALGNAALQKQISDGARSLAQQFSWDRIADETLQLYESTLC